MSASRTIKASDLTANDIGRRVSATTLTGVLIEDVLAEVRYFEPSLDGRKADADEQPEPRVWVRFKHAAAAADFARFGIESDNGFFLSPTSEAFVE